MSAKLVALAGPLQGREYAIEGEFSLGRGSQNLLRIGDTSLSRQHCTILAGGPPFVLQDLGSKNGTFVNGVPIAERTLQDGDQIKAGLSLFLFLAEQPKPSPSANGVELSLETIRAESTVLLSRKDARYPEPSSIVEQLPDRDQALRDLKTLLRIGAAIPHIRDADALQGELLDRIFQVIPAQRGAILLTEDPAAPTLPNEKAVQTENGGRNGNHQTNGATAEQTAWQTSAVQTGEITASGDASRETPWAITDEAGSVAYRSRTSGAESSIVIPRTVIRQVLKDNSAILANDVLLAVDGTRSDSLVAAKISSLLAVPLVILDRTLGVVYLDTTDRQTRFREDHLQLLTGIAGMAAVALDNALHIRRLERDKRRLTAEINLRHNLMGKSVAIRSILEFIAKVAPSGSTVLICGESGTGKELVARAIHANSPRADGPFVAIDCATLTENLLETELFGHERGSFTGAIAQKRGQLEQAQGGTVFLDEMGELPVGLQAKLLRVLQEREFQRVGGNRKIKADIRLVAATNRDLESAVRDGSFRQDLYYRLNVVSIKIPALRERKEDIALLAQYFVQRHARTVGRPVIGLSRHAMAALTAYEWPGNVRELENAIERAVVLGSGDTIQIDDLPENIIESLHPADEQSAGYHEAVAEAKRQIILNALDRTGGSYVEAAKALGLQRSNLHRLMKNLNLKGD